MLFNQSVPFEGGSEEGRRKWSDREMFHVASIPLHHRGCLRLKFGAAATAATAKAVEVANELQQFRGFIGERPYDRFGGKGGGRRDPRS